MSEFVFWIASGILWTIFAYIMLKGAISVLHEDNKQSTDRMLTLHRESNVVLFGLCFGGLICADLAGAVILAARQWPDLLSNIRIIAIVLIILTLNALGGVSWHLWRTRRKLETYWMQSRVKNMTGK